MTNSRTLPSTLSGVRLPWAWYLYDFANSAYVLLVIAFAFPLYFRERLIPNPQNADWIWGVTLGMSVILAGILAPAIGSVLDARGGHGTAFRALASLAVCGTASLAFLPPGNVLLASAAFVVTNAAFNLSVALYDSSLGHLRSGAKTAEVSATGWGIGYLGGILCLLVVLPWVKALSQGDTRAFRIIILTTAAWYGVFSLPILLSLPRSFGSARTGPITLLKSTLVHWHEHRRMFMFIIGYFFLTDATGTLTDFASIVARNTLHFSISEIATLLLLVQLVAIPATLASGRLAGRLGARAVLIGGTLGWITVCVWMYWAQSAVELYSIALIISAVIGSTYASARTVLVGLAPQAILTQAFGFNALSGKVSETIAPMLFGWISVRTGSQRMAIVGMLPFLLIALGLFIADFWYHQRERKSQTAAGTGSGCTVPRNRHALSASTPRAPSDHVR